MRFLSIIALAGALAACGSNPSDEAETTPEEQGQMTENATLDDKALAALQQCEQVEPTCGNDGYSYLVFPDVTSVALGVGGEGGEGALIRNGQVVDYYNMGEASIGLQAGVSAASYVFKMPNQESLAQFEDDGEWSIGAESSVVIANADANAAAETAGGKTVLYVFNAEGLMADVSVDAMRIWKDTNSASDENMEAGMTETTDS
ncbi:YSC84-related protein [Qipengyuania gelatinilytica]|uniref:Ysc84 actin-binding domain-containing protein n=1 Tax=Qipengyuania gelatinilytica TaxID=2867231 RepID=A0ABX9A1V3_9SPHN|nr:YSC84-related protein [Qipengyuania gelatinilytica]QZD95213.1 hypothetical protein K3136_00315 [Qipengyuania gelatinilytica]